MEIPTKEEAEAILINETFYDKLISVTDLKSYYLRRLYTRTKFLHFIVTPN